MKSLNEIADFLENHIIECEKNTGCGRCDEARECVISLRAQAKVHQRELIEKLMEEDEKDSLYDKVRNETQTKDGTYEFD